MKKQIILLVFMSILNSCSSQSTDFEGKWFLKSNLDKTIEISKNGDSYIFEESGKKYPAIIKDKMLEINGTSTIKAVIQNEVLIINGKEYLKRKNAEKLIREKKIKEGKRIIVPELNKLNNLFIKRSELSIYIAKEMGEKGEGIRKTLLKNKDYYNAISLDNKDNIISYFKKTKEDEKEINKIFLELERLYEIKSKHEVQSRIGELEGLGYKINVQRNRYNELLNKYKNILEFPYFKVEEEKKKPNFNFGN